MLRVVLQVDSGPRAGHKLLVRAGQRLSVGRSGASDLSVEQDHRMSNLHFELIAESRTCFLIDAGSTNGTRVNGEPAERIELRDGDQVVAGSTRFHVEVEGADTPTEAASPAPTGAADGNANPPATAVDPGPLALDSLDVESLATGLHVGRGTGSVIQLAERLVSIAPLSLIVDFQKLGQPAPESVAQFDPLFDWLPEQALGGSPLVLPAGDETDWQSIVSQSWSHDSLVLIFSSLPRADLLLHLRGLTRAGTERQPRLFGICWPCVLGIQLSFGAADLAQKIMSNIECIVIEKAGAAEWQLFSHKEPAELLGSPSKQPESIEDRYKENES